MNKKRYLIIVGIVTAAVLLSILFYTMLANHRPIITSLVAEPEGVTPLGSCHIVCNATDPDGDELSYGWSASGGTISAMTVAGEQATFTWTAPRSAGSYNVTVIVTDGRGGVDMQKVTIEVRANRPPTINSLLGDAVWTAPSGNLQVTCNAADPDGDVLSYEWTTTGGSISGTDAVVNWTAPQETGIYNITVVVKDGYGGEDRKFVSLSVALGTPPTIANMIITAKEPKYLKTITEGYYYKVGKEKQYDIECVASNMSGEVSYEWSCEDGTISGEGSTITWTAPNETLTRTTVTVIVSDVADNRVSKSMDFQVVSCNACTFG